MRGRPPALNEQQFADVLQQIRAGSSAVVAAAALGLDPITITRTARRLGLTDELKSALKAGRDVRNASVPHGRYRYVQYGCKCAVCLSANCEYTRNLRAALSTRLAEAVHGRASTYTGWGCRCEPCTKAHTAYQKPYVAAWVARQRAAASVKS